MSVTSTDSPPTLSQIARVFPNVKHVALGFCAMFDSKERSVELEPEAPLRFDSLHMCCSNAKSFLSALKAGVRCEISCLSLRWEISAVTTQSRAVVAELLSLMPSLRQLAITGDAHRRNYSDNQLEALPSIFGSCSGLLPKLTYLQLSAGSLLTEDMEYLLSSSSPPAFTASLTHLALSVEESDSHLAGQLSLLPTIYLHLQRCHVGLNQRKSGNNPNAEQEWRTAVAALRSQLSSVWCESEGEVRIARSDVEWRRSVGLPVLADEWTGDLLHRR